MEISYSTLKLKQNNWLFISLNFFFSFPHTKLTGGSALSYLEDRVMLLVLLKIITGWHEKTCFSLSARGPVISTGEIKHMSVVEKRQESHLPFHFSSEYSALWRWHKPTLKITT